MQRTPTYKTTGLTKGSHCLVCKEVIKKQEVIEQLNHNYIDGNILDNKKYLKS